MTLSRLKWALAVAALGVATVAFGTGVAKTVSAQQPPAASPSPSPSVTAPGPKRGDWQARQEQFLSALASKLGVSVDRLKQAITEARQEVGLPQRPAGRFGGPWHRGLGLNLETAARAMNISVDQLRQELPGKSLADVARAHNVDPSTVADALKSAAASRIDQAVSAGRISADQASQIKQRINERIDQLMTRQVPADAFQRGMKPQWGHGRPGGQPQARGGPGL